jgi:hypothetical protein
MNIRKIVEAWLKADGYDGLCDLDCDYEGCGCLLDDLMPCDEPSPENCRAGYKGPPGPDGGDYAIYPTREAALAAKENPDGE